MRVFGIWAAAVVCLLAAMGSRSAAAVAPVGSYQESCIAIRMQNGTLYANCQAADGRYYPSALNVNQCPTRNVANNNGTLVCEQSGYGGGYGGGGNVRRNDRDGDADDRGNYGRNNRLPGGSWRSSCRNATLDSDDHLLYANCQTDDGNWNRSWLNMSNCPSRVVGNSNGSLFCENGQRYYGSTYGTGLPPGSWQQSCQNAQMSGSMLYADCDTGFGSYQATSLDVSACPNGPVGNNGGRLYCGGAYIRQ